MLYTDENHAFETFWNNPLAALINPLDAQQVIYCMYDDNLTVERAIEQDGIEVMVL